MRTRNLMMLLVILLVTLLAACRPVSVEQAQADYCADLNAYKAAVDALGNLTAESTVEEAHDAMDVVADARDDLQRSASILTDANADAFYDAADELEDSIRDIEASESISDAVDAIQTQVANVSTAYDEAYPVNCE